MGNEQVNVLGTRLGYEKGQKLSRVLVVSIGILTLNLGGLDYGKVCSHCLESYN